MTIDDPVIDADLNAYVDGQLDAARRIEVEAYLAGNPTDAARVMADLSMSGELRLALATGRNYGRAETRDAARRLERGLVLGRFVQAVQRVAAVALLMTAGWVAHTSFGAFTATEVAASTPAPAFVEDAVRSYRTTLVRQGMPSQAPDEYKPEDIRAATGIVLPELPKDLVVSDSQVFPSKFGPSLEIALQEAQKRPLSLFAVRPGTFSVQPVQHVAIEGAQAAYWQIGEVAYALVADDPAVNIDAIAKNLNSSLY